jgi:hypothetical protein
MKNGENQDASTLSSTEMENLKISSSMTSSQPMLMMTGYSSRVVLKVMNSGL